MSCQCWGCKGSVFPGVLRHPLHSYRWAHCISEGGLFQRPAMFWASSQTLLGSRLFNWKVEIITLIPGLLRRAVRCGQTPALSSILKDPWVFLWHLKKVLVLSTLPLLQAPSRLHSPGPPPPSLSNSTLHHCPEMSPQLHGAHLRLCLFTSFGLNVNLVLSTPDTLFCSLLYPQHLDHCRRRECQSMCLECPKELTSD